MIEKRKEEIWENKHLYNVQKLHRHYHHHLHYHGNSVITQQLFRSHEVTPVVCVTPVLTTDRGDEPTAY